MEIQFFMYIHIKDEFFKKNANNAKTIKYYAKCEISKPIKYGAKYEISKPIQQKK